MQQNGHHSRFDPANRVISATDAAGHSSRYLLAKDGKLEGHTSGAGRVSRLQFDDHSHLTDLVEPSGRRTQVQYDAQGAPTLFVRDGAALARFAWNAERTRNTAEFWDGTHTSSLYTKAGRPLQFSDRLNQCVTFSYDDLGRLRALSDGAQQTTEFRWDAQGQPSQTLHPDGRVEQIDHVAGGAVVVSVGKRQLFSKESDEQGRPLKVSYADGAVDSFAYDEAGRLLCARGPEGASVYTYRDDGKLVSEQSGDQTFAFEYDTLGLMKSLAYPDGSRARFHYDPDRRLSHVEWGEANVEIAYDTHDQRRRITTPRLQTHVLLDTSGKLARASVMDRITGSTRFDTQYRYDVQSRVTSKVDSDCGERHFRYDPQSQLVAVTTADGRRSETFAYDAAGNRTHASGETALVMPGNRLEAQGEWRCSYDERGNLVGLSSVLASYQFVYDLKNQLCEARGPFGLITFKYDALGRRIEKRSDDRTIRFVWCGELLTRELVTTPLGETVRDYLYRPGSYEPLALRVDGRYYYYHNDQQGTPQRLTDEHGEVVWRADYFAFGFAEVKIGRVENPLRLLGQYADVETGLHYNRFRYYSPTLGRYCSTDPVSLLGGHNLYCFANNDPLNRFDPLGLFSWGAVAAGVAAAAAAVAVVVLAPAAIPLMLAVVGGAAIGVALGLGVAEATGINHFCWPCFLKGAENAFPTAFGLGFGIAAIAVVCPPLGAVLAVGAAAYGTYALLDEYFGWSSGKPFDDMTDQEKSQALGGLVGGTVGGLAGGMAGGAFGEGLAEGLKGPAPEVEMTRGPAPAAGEQGPEPVYRENIGKDLPPDEAARIMDDRTRSVAEQDAAETRANKEAREAREAERQSDQDAIDDARQDEVAKGKRVGELKKAGAPPEDVEQATNDARDASASRKALQDDYALREQARQKAAAADPENHNGKVYEPAYDPETGEMVVANQGDVPAGPSVLRPAQSVDPSTAPGKCAMPRAASILNDDAAAAGRPPPKLQTTDGGHTVRIGEVQPIDACKNCQAIKAEPANQIETVSPNRSAVPDPMPMPGGMSSPNDDDQEQDQP